MLYELTGSVCTYPELIIQLGGLVRAPATVVVGSDCCSWNSHDLQSYHLGATKEEPGTDWLGRGLDDPIEHSPLHVELDQSDVAPVVAIDSSDRFGGEDLNQPAGKMRPK